MYTRKRYNALLDITQGSLSPAKTQCYFVPYGSTVKLTTIRTMKVVKQLPEVTHLWDEAAHERNELAPSLCLVVTWYGLLNTPIP